MVNSACSYYMAREQMEKADLIFIPYNYLIDPQTRNNQNLSVAKAILILDEAHNLVMIQHTYADRQIDMNPPSHVARIN